MGQSHSNQTASSSGLTLEEKIRRDKMEAEFTPANVSAVAIQDMQERVRRLEDSDEESPHPPSKQVAKSQEMPLASRKPGNSNKLVRSDVSAPVVKEEGVPLDTDVKVLEGTAFR
uniref:Uncharacterized protein n=1 Tax=Palpitomonas bilix TaxID=652834 RepID=A0A7S3LT21_9EUKA|mmetsp:Transcript_45317/g.117266  ORF Transcript_45317/g.117266 Transcript_45317/m.117266 type:complete len:115 (+) Transcript_45317:359-703(+)|eukprot:CAMPEP_0113883386 /NCGR_PEP_ID=MMETSP0780_2-20120614/9563_1 /TAXON_ID=652834 /ORGANISM="Palpitomonas bilix" /LENGTH=114 /DNA_ID=CAMNT_0000870669 /DNA_START=228 /DNA_END=575 /DNA_ORIENTATION=- /assembly_acc=CAM_ASM_000599